MTTDQKFFQNIVHSNAITYEALEKIVGNMNKNIGISAKFYEYAAQVLGSTVTENYDLASLFGADFIQVNSDQTDLLQQSLQNCYSGIANSISYPQFDVSTHISTTISNYNLGVSSAFLSGQIYGITGVGIGTTSVISIPYSSFSLAGNQFNSHLIDVPVDFAVYGINSFNGLSYINTKLIKFDYSWSYAYPTTNLLVNLQFLNTSPSSTFYLAFYWGNTDSSFISTNNNVSGNIKYVGTQNFINQIGILTNNIKSASVNVNLGRKNFWSNDVPYNLGFTSQSFVDPDCYLWSPERINATIFDGTPSTQTQPLRYPILNDVYLNGILTSNSNYSYFFGNFYNNGTGDNQGLNAQLNLDYLFDSNYSENVNYYPIEKRFTNDVPLNLLVFQKNPKKTGLNFSNGYSLISETQVLPSAFVKVITDNLIWENFAENLIEAKGYFLILDNIIVSYLGTLDNFIADFFFGVNFNNVTDYFSGESLIVSRNTLKDFTQPYGTNRIEPLNFSEYEEKSIYEATSIVASKEYMTFDQGRLTMLNTYKLPSDIQFEIFKPISFVCDGIDPYNQGNGLAFDYTLNLSFAYNNQNTLNKILYLMSSKYVISKSDYDFRLDNNQETIGYYYIANPDSTDYNDYSVSSIEEFRLYGYAGIIPDLKDGMVRPILTRAFSPVDTSKYTYEQYVALLISQGITDPDDIADAVQEYLDQGNTFYTIDLNTQSSAFASLEKISLCMTNYIYNSEKYWNDVLYSYNVPPTQGIVGEATGFTDLNAQILSGIVSSPTTMPPYTINNVPVGFNCEVSSIQVLGFGSFLSPGTYKSWLMPQANLVTNEQPAQIEYTILSQGIIDPSSIEILNVGANFSFNFNTFLTDVGFTTNGIGTTHTNVKVIMNNVAEFSATVDSGYNLTNFVQTKAPSLGYNAGFKFNKKAFVGLGYTSNVDVNILINNYPTVDSFIISNTNLQPGALESFSNFQNTQTNLSALNYSSGNQFLTLYDDEIYNQILVPANYGNLGISYLTVNCKLIELNNANPSGFISAHIYAVSGDTRTEVASSDHILVSEINRYSYQSLDIPLSFNFTNTSLIDINAEYWVSLKQNLDNCFLSVQGTFVGISTSYFGISTDYIFNDTKQIMIPGSISTTGYDLDLSKATIGLSSVFGSNVLTSDTKQTLLNLRRNSEYTSATNQIYVGVTTTYNGFSDTVYSDVVLTSSLSTIFTGVAFTFSNSLLSGTEINSYNILTTRRILQDQIYTCRSLNEYDGVQLGIGTSSLIGIGNTTANFNFVFNKLFSQVNNDIYGAFNYTDSSQFGLAKPNRLREMSPITQVDGYWSFKSDAINSPISIYPRAALSNSSVIGTTLPEYQYLNYTHDIYVNLGFNSNGLYYQPDPINLSAGAKWKTTWMDRTESNYKNFSIFDVAQLTYERTVDYIVGSAKTIIGVNTGPKCAIFEGTFTPLGNQVLEVPVIVGIGTSSGVQVYVNSGSVPIIDTFNVVSSGYSTSVGLLTTSVRENPVNFKILYYTFSTAAISVYWNVGFGRTLIGVGTGTAVYTPSPVSINSGYPVDNIVFLNVSKTYEDAISVNNGFPPGDSFVIRSS